MFRNDKRLDVLLDKLAGLKSRLDSQSFRLDAEERWITIKGSHVLLGKDGSVKYGAGGKFSKGSPTTSKSSTAVKVWKHSKTPKNMFWLAKALSEQGVDKDEFRNTMKQEFPELDDADSHLDEASWTKAFEKQAKKPKGDQLISASEALQREEKESQRLKDRQEAENSNPPPKPQPAKAKEVQAPQAAPPGNEKDQFLEKFSKDYIEDLTPDQQKAVELYREGLSVPLNKNERRSSKNKELAKIGADLQSAVDKSVLPVDSKIYRGINGTFSRITGGLSPEDAVGKEFTHKGFFSSSRDRRVAAEFSSSMGVGTSGPNHVEIWTSLKAGTKGVMVMPDQDAGEKEILLRSNARFRIVGISGEPNDLSVQVEYLPPEDHRADSIEHARTPLMIMRQLEDLGRRLSRLEKSRGL